MLEGENMKQGFYMMIYGEIWEGFGFLESERIKSRRMRSWKDMEAKEEGKQGRGRGNKAARDNK